MPIPYMGSKRVSSGKIYRAINNREKKGTLIDLFCGGFAISEKFIREGWKVISNDKNKYVVALIEKTINKGLDESIMTQWISRKKFYDVVENPEKYDDWYVGYVQCIWSFGNTQTNYLFGKKSEPIKHAGHNLVIGKDATDIQRLILDIPKRYIEEISSLDNWHKRRIALAQVSHKLKTRILRLQQLERLEQLQQLERFQLHERLQIFNSNYNKVIIPKDAIIYCDPPYQGVGEYFEGQFNHIEFWDWVRKISKTNKIYISEYSAPSDFETILKFSQKSTLQGGTQSHNNQPMECLFVLKGQEKFKNN